jgi:hypothetical protein
MVDVDEDVVDAVELAEDGFIAGVEELGVEFAA